MDAEDAFPAVFSAEDDEDPLASAEPLFDFAPEPESPESEPEDDEPFDARLSARLSVR